MRGTTGPWVQFLQSLPVQIETRRWVSAGENEHRNRFVFVLIEQQCHNVWVTHETIGHKGMKGSPFVPRDGPRTAERLTHYTQKHTQHISKRSTRFFTFK